jgi:hypothetical protein
MIYLVKVGAQSGASANSLTWSPFGNILENSLTRSLTGSILNLLAWPQREETKWKIGDTGIHFAGDNWRLSCNSLGYPL